MAGYWPRYFFASLWTSTSSWSINSQKKELGQYPAILTSHLVNNPYVLTPSINHFALRASIIVIIRGLLMFIPYMGTDTRVAESLYSHGGRSR